MQLAKSVMYSNLRYIQLSTVVHHNYILVSTSRLGLGIISDFYAITTVQDYILLSRVRNQFYLVDSS